MAGRERLTVSNAVAATGATPIPTHIVPFRTSLASVGLIIAIAVASASVLLMATPWGLGLSPDSAVYIGGARSLIGGHGFALPAAQDHRFTPVTHYPPLYSILLAAAAVFGADVLDAARWVHSVLFAASIALAAGLAVAAGASRALGACAATLAATAFPMVLVHSMAWSEPLGIALELATLTMLLAYLRAAWRPLLVGAAVTAGLGALCRYAALAFIASGLVVVLWNRGRPAQSRLADGALFFCIAATPVCFWLVRNLLLTGSPVNRTVAFHPAGFAEVVSSAVTVLGWFWPLPLFGEIARLVMALVITAALAAVLLYGRRNSAAVAELARDPSPARFVLVTAILSYLVLLFGAISFLDRQTPLDSRVLAPLYPLLITLAVSAPSQTGELLQWSRMKRTATGVLVCGFLVALQLPLSWSWLAMSRADGIGYASRTWRESPLIIRVRSLPPTPIFSNAPDVLYALLGKPAAMIPRKIYPDTRRANGDYQLELEQMRATLQKSHGFMVYFHVVQWRWYLPTAEELEKRLSLILVVGEKDGSIYRVDEVAGKL